MDRYGERETQDSCQYGMRHRGGGEDEAKPVVSSSLPRTTMTTSLVWRLPDTSSPSPRQGDPLAGRGEKGVAVDVGLNQIASVLDMGSIGGRLSLSKPTSNI